MSLEPRTKAGKALNKAIFWERSPNFIRDAVEAAIPAIEEQAAALDVDALERAYVRVLDRTPWVEVMFSANGVLETQRRMFLERIAAEYALSSPSSGDSGEHR